ncbi:hypothetical protein SELMODRAFT_127193, partial [Selaginella moellendorffii]
GSILYVSFGSISSISVAELESLFDGLERSKEARRERANRHGLVVRWAPQL